jgi:hypothetical protein
MNWVTLLGLLLTPVFYAVLRRAKISQDLRGRIAYGAER